MRSGVLGELPFATIGLVAALSAALALAVSAALAQNPPPLAVAIGAGVGLVLLLALAAVRLDLAVGLGIALLGVVVVDPAPSDGIFLVVIALTAATGAFRLDGVPAAILVTLVLFVAVNVLATVQAEDLPRALIFSASTYYLVFLAVWLAGWITSRARARLVLKAYVVGAVASAALGSAAYLAPMPGRDILTAYDATRATGLFQDPNVFGSFLFPAAFLVLAEVLEPSLLRWRRLTALAAFVVLDVGVVLSFSRAAWGSLVLGLAVMIGVIALRRGGLRRASAVLGVALVTVAVGAAVLSATGSLGFLQQRAGVQTYDTARFSAQEVGVRLVSEHPLGIGPGQFELASDLSAHSTYIRGMAELGIVGVVTIVALFLITLVLAARHAVIGRDLYGIGSAPLLGAWCGLMLSGFVIDTLHWRHLWLVGAMIWAAAAIRPARFS